MDPTSFDRLTRLVSTVRSRRSLGGLGIGLLGTLLGVEAVVAAPCPKGRKKCKQKCIAKKKCCTNANCRPKTTGRVCRGGRCVCPPGGKTCLGRCIPQANCCQNADCPPTATCAGGSCVTLPCGAGGPCLAFVTSEERLGDLGGITGGDALCQSLATAAGLSGTYRAWLSTSAQTPLDSGFVQSTGPYVRVDGTVIAANFAGLISGQMQAPLEVNEQGTIIPVGLVWTGTLGDGTWAGNDPVVQGVEDCDGWTDDSGMAGGAYGQSNLTGSGWTFGGALNCSVAPLPIYCFQQS